jgi:hypothetical protein
MRFRGRESPLKKTVAINEWQTKPSAIYQTAVLGG